jgi:hypothetical protein
MAMMVLYIWLIEMALSPASTNGFNAFSVFPGPGECSDEIMDFIKVLSGGGCGDCCYLTGSAGKTADWTSQPSEDNYQRPSLHILNSSNLSNF